MQSEVKKLLDEDKKKIRKAIYCSIRKSFPNFCNEKVKIKTEIVCPELFKFFIQEFERKMIFSEKALSSCSPCPDFLIEDTCVIVCQKSEDATKAALDKDAAKAASDKDAEKAASDKDAAKAALDKDAAKAASDKDAAKAASDKDAAKAALDKDAEKAALDKGAAKVALDNLKSCVTQFKLPGLIIDFSSENLKWYYFNSKDAVLDLVEDLEIKKNFPTPTGSSTKQDDPPRGLSTNQGLSARGLSTNQGLSARGDYTNEFLMTAALVVGGITTLLFGGFGLLGALNKKK